MSLICYYIGLYVFWTSGHILQINLIKSNMVPWSQKGTQIVYCNTGSFFDTH